MTDCGLVIVPFRGTSTVAVETSVVFPSSLMNCEVMLSVNKLGSTLTSAKNGMIFTALTKTNNHSILLRRYQQFIKRTKHNVMIGTGIQFGLQKEITHADDSVKSHFGTASNYLRLNYDYKVTERFKIGIDTPLTTSYFSSGLSLGFSVGYYLN